MIIRKLFASVFLFLAVVMWAVVPQAKAWQMGPANWSAPFHVAGEVNYETWSPKLISDDAGDLHMIWLAWVGADQPSRLVANTIFYSHWDGSEWSDPIDIIASAGAANLGSPDLISTADGRLLLAWESQGNGFLAQSSVRTADNARNWVTMSLGPGSNPRIAYDATNDFLYLTMSDTNRRQLELLRSIDLGQSWQSPVELWSTEDASRAISNEQVAVDNNGDIHAVWVEHSEEKNWQGEAIWRAFIASTKPAPVVQEMMRSDQTDDPTLGSPKLVFGHNGDAYLIWNNGVGSLTGRFFARSQDDGATWTEPSPLFPGISGQTGSAGVAIDSSGVLHLATAADGDGYGYGVVRYATLTDGVWSPYYTLPADQFVGEHPSLELTHGNQLHLVWTQLQKIADSSVGRVSYSFLKLGTPNVQPSGFPETDLATASISVPTPAETLPLDNTVTAYLIEDAETSAAALPLSEVQGPSSTISGGAAVLVGVLPVLGLVLVVLTRRMRRNASR